MNATIRNGYWHPQRRLAWRGVNLLVIVAMLLTLGAGLVKPTQAASQTSGGKPVSIEPGVYVALEQKGQAEVLVILKEQADLSAAALLDTKTDKGAFVYQQLTAVAARTQGPLKEFLDSKGAAYRAYWIVNCSA
jgi:hypothetical protein